VKIQFEKMGELELEVALVYEGGIKE